MFGLPYQYGFPKITLDRQKINTVILRSHLLPLFSKYYQDYLVYLIYSSSDKLQQRIHKRKQDGEEPGNRLDEFNKEFQESKNIANRIFLNENIEDMLLEIKNALNQDFI